MALPQSNNDHGIHLYGQQIKKLSGPVSFYYLKPSEEAWNRFHEKETDLPLLLLMGDIHFQTSNRCTPCSPPSCYAIEDKSFLRLFDRLAEHTPVDVFTESFRDIMENDKKDPEQTYKGVMGPFLRTTQRAHRVSHRSIPLRNNENKNTLVPTTRWHYTNIRTSSKAIESRLIRPFLDRLTFLKKTMKGEAPTHPPSPLTVPREIGSLLADILDDFMSVTKRNMIPITTRSLERILFSLEGEFAGESMVIKQYKQSAIRHHLPIRELIPFLSNELIDRSYYFSALSLFIKSNEPLAKRRYQQEMSVLRSMCRYILLEEPLQGPTGASPFTMDVFQERADMIIELFNSLETCLMDLYFLFRMLKQPKNNITSTLCLAYFGQIHIETILHLLTSPLFGYTIVYKNVGSMEWFRGHNGGLQPSRCMDIRHPIYLEKDVMEHHHMRFGNSMERVTPYYKTIQQEKQRRGPASTQKNKNNSKNNSKNNKKNNSKNNKNK